MVCIHDFLTINKQFHYFNSFKKTQGEEWQPSLLLHTHTHIHIQKDG